MSTTQFLFGREGCPLYRFERRLKLVVNGITKSEKIILANMETLREYAEYLKASGKSLPRQDKLLRTTKILAELLDSTPFKEATKKTCLPLNSSEFSKKIERIYFSSSHGNRNVLKKEEF